MKVKSDFKKKKYTLIKNVLDQKMCGFIYNYCKLRYMNLIDFKKFLNKSVSETRGILGIDTTLIRGCYIAERALFKKSVESQRLI